MAKYEYKVSRFTYNGKPYKCFGKTQKEADQKAVLKQAALESGKIGISNNMITKNWCNQWLKVYKQGKVLDKTYKSYLRFINSYIIPAIGNVKLKDVTNTMLQGIINSRSEYSKSDNSKLRYAIQQIFKKAKSARHIMYDPSEDLEISGEETKERRSITEHERTMILKTAETHHAGLWVKTMLYCGLRNGEIIALDWIDVDLDKKLIYISKAKESGNNNIKAPKTKAGKREVPIPDILLHDLIKAKHGKNPYDPVFTQLKTGRRYSDKGFNRAWNNFLRQMDIENGAVVFNNKIVKSVIASDLIPYYLRHSYCTSLEEAGVPINVAKRLMGHSNILITSKIYTHGTGITRQAAADKINAYHKSG